VTVVLMPQKVRSRSRRHEERAKRFYLARELSELEQFATELGFDEVAMFISMTMLVVEDTVVKEKKRASS
jgi:hypothetical protein